MSPWRWRRRQPAPPENLRLHYPDGRTIPLECTYQGREDGPDGHRWHVWLVVAPASVPFEEGMAMECDALPDRTVVALPVGVPPWSP